MFGKGFLILFAGGQLRRIGNRLPPVDWFPLLPRDRSSFRFGSLGCGCAGRLFSARCEWQIRFSPPDRTPTTNNGHAFIDPYLFLVRGVFAHDRFIDASFAFCRYVTAFFLMVFFPTDRTGIPRPVIDFHIGFFR